jgi:hypothetical protein
VFFEGEKTFRAVFHLVKALHEFVSWFVTY